jgi:4'-phosphopantetheinyl transferase
MRARRAGTPLPRGEVHLWHVDPEGITDPALLDAYHDLLSADERERQQRFRFARDRHRHVVTRALVRTLLSRYAAVDPRAWVFRTNRHGRPEIARPRGVPALRFNVSHTSGMIVCGLALGRDVGVDVEDTTRRSSTIAIADRYFSPAEVADLRAVPPARQRAAFWEYWTLKESYIKARGMGLALPLGRFSFHLGDPGAIRISFDPRLPDDPASWQFRVFRPNARHVVAVAFRRQAGEEAVDVRIRAVVPLRSEGELERWERLPPPERA